MKIKYLVYTAVVVSAGLMSLVCYKSFYSVIVPEPKNLTHEGIAKFIASDDFSKLPQEEKGKFLEKMGPPEPGRTNPEENLSDVERKNLHENMRPMFESMMKKRVEEYFAMSPEKRQEYLDQEIERMDEMRKNGNGGPGGPGGPGKGPPPKPDAQQLKNMFETGDPVTKAKMHQFFSDMHQRMEQQK